MRKVICAVLLTAMVLSVPGQAFAAITGAEVAEYKLPILITNAGQGPGGKMARLLVSQAKEDGVALFKLDEDYFYNAEPWEEDLEEREYSCLMIVIGSTDKGLGASGITIDDEIARLEKMIAYAQEIELPIVAVLLEKDKRSTIKTNANERCIDVVCPAADWMIVVKDGNSDNRFTKISEEYDIPLTIIDNSLDFTVLAKEMLVFKLTEVKEAAAATPAPTAAPKTTPAPTAKPAATPAPTATPKK